MKTLSLIPAYARDYKSKKEVLADLTANKDFTIADVSCPFHGKYVNLSQLLREGYNQVSIRYKKLTQIVIIDLSKVDVASATDRAPGLTFGDVLKSKRR